MFRNFIHTLRRYTMASVLNILGLSVAFAAFVIIMMQVSFERNFDKTHKKSDRIYMVDQKVKFENFSGVTVVSRAFVDHFGACSPLIESFTMIELPWGKTYFTVDQNGNKAGFSENLSPAYPSLPEVFDFNMVEGVQTVLDEPNKVVVPLSFARKAFGEESAIGKMLVINEKRTYEIGGVYEDLPANTQIKNFIYYKIPDSEGRKEDGSDNWGMSNFLMYVVLHPGADPRDVEAEFNKKMDLAQAMDMGGTKGSTLPEMTLLSDLYYKDNPKMLDHLITHGNRDTTNIMLAIAFLIILIAAINFVNFSTSLAPLRMKSINIQKILGSLDSKLRAILIAEAVGICIISFAASLLIVYMIGESPFKDLTLSGISFTGNWTLIGYSGALAVAVGIIAGIYPAFYSTRFSPVMVLKGSFAMSRWGRILRTSLIGFQFVISIGLIVAAMFMQIQNGYMRNMNTGLDKDQVAIVELSGNMKGRDALEGKLLESSLIKDVAYSQFIIGGSDMSQGWGMKYKEKSIQFSAHIVSWNFPQVMGLKMVEGNYFTETDQNATKSNFIFNEAAAKKFEMTLGDRIGWAAKEEDNGEIKGFVEDFNFQSLHFDVTPMAFVISSWSKGLPYAYVKISGDPYAGVEHIRKAVAAVDPSYPADIRFYDQIFDQLYQKERKTTKLISFFSALAVIISLVGVFGLVVFETQYRRKEIGLRKINGATTGSILAMFNGKFIWIVGVCFVIAAPLAWYGVNEWLKGFAYRTPMHWWVFALALLIVITITLLTVTIQSWRAATENPVKSLKSE